MRATLHVVSESGARRRLEVRGGQVARFGRSDWADYSFPDDPKMADVHFVVECRESAVVLRDLATGSPTLLNDKPASEAVLRTGDRVSAGRTTWVVQLEDVPAATASDGSESNDAIAPPPTQTALEWVELLVYLGVEDEALAIPQDGQTADDLVAALVAEQQFAAAAQLRAHQLQARGAVWWGYGVVEQSGTTKLSAPQRAALAKVREWVARPNETNCRACEKQAEALGYKGPGGFLSAAAFFSGESVAPADCPAPTPPDPRLPGRLVTGLLHVAVAEAKGEEPAAVWKRILDKAAQLLAGEISWPEPTPAPAA